MIELMDITKKYGSNIVLDKLNFRFPDFGLFLIRGYNGSGKTTLLTYYLLLIKTLLGMLLLIIIVFLLYQKRTKISLERIT